MVLKLGRYRFAGDATARTNRMYTQQADSNRFRNDHKNHTSNGTIVA